MARYFGVVISAPGWPPGHQTAALIIFTIAITVAVCAEQVAHDEDWYNSLPEKKQELYRKWRSLVGGLSDEGGIDGLTSVQLLTKTAVTLLMHSTFLHHQQITASIFRNIPNNPAWPKGDKIEQDRLTETLNFLNWMELITFDDTDDETFINVDPFVHSLPREESSDLGTALGATVNLYVEFVGMYGVVKDLALLRHGLILCAHLLDYPDMFFDNPTAWNLPTKVFADALQAGKPLGALREMMLQYYEMFADGPEGEDMREHDTENQLFGPTGIKTLDMRRSLALWLFESGSPEEGIAELDDIHLQSVDQFGPNHRMTVSIAETIGWLHKRLDREEL